MDIIIMLLVLGIAVLMLRSSNRTLIIALWAVTLIAMLCLFKYHASDPIPLSF